MKTDNYKSTLKNVKYEFKCPDCGHDLVLVCYPVIWRNAFNRITKIICTDKEDNIVDTLYSCGDTENFDMEDTEEPVVFSCQYCQKTWTSLEDMIADGIIKLLD